ncbi:hypothetical protein TBLA_0C06470 [Henningerozyma blattae CBS 6284]|uniref:SPX domain-containing protein n=1 Tax=Henningerozyma blattae (strain ATCC 34711 / CBS 6284 / DSM 70876 / NBRC 10599 / NRRL Y-10934 / UCD 77-7) TaxID=1071380 RepID=I2H238_HENB6|nr:hypothetical protein TBLA_0C06470 [Tetrapisispora blattae CBS 6284]CCH60440.1 hypothetical protein TBLA_0C06470 [Tetrapisispora blattae CBS 6284]
MKFGKHLEARQLEFLEHNGHFMDYKALKKVIKQLAFPINDEPSLSNNGFETDNNITTISNDVLLDSDNDMDQSIIHKRLQENKATFFFKLERELEKVNSYYLEKEIEMHVKFDILNSKYNKFIEKQKNTTTGALAYKNLYSGLRKLQHDLSDLEQYVELNRTGFSKVLKKWDKRSCSHQKEFYLATVVLVQPVFTHTDISELTDTALNMISELEKEKYFKMDSNNSFLNTKDTKQKLDRSLISSSIHKSTILLTNGVNSFDSSSVIEVGFDDKAVTSMSDSLDSDIELETSNWYAELLNISKLSDHEKRLQMLHNFTTNKIEKYFNSFQALGNAIEKTVILKDIVTKIFILLIDTKMDDEALKIFYENCNSYINLTYYEESKVFSSRNIIHEAARCTTQSRAFILEELLSNTTIPKDTVEQMLNKKDFNFRCPIHYTSELGKSAFTNLILNAGPNCSIDILDSSSKTPLILAIENGHNDIVRALLHDGKSNPFPRCNNVAIQQFIPLNVACYNNNYDAAAMLLEPSHVDLSSLFDAHGLAPLHIVSKIGGDPKLIDLLIKRGADPNGIDKFSKWTPLFYAVQQDHADTVTELLKHGAKTEIVDEENLNPLFYALWEGYVEVLNCLPKSIESTRPRPDREFSIDSVDSLNSFDISNPIDELVDIPDFTLPPPIIPLRKYGHNFLEKKIIVKVGLRSDQSSIKLFNNIESIFLAPGRITITSNIAGIFPRNVVLPLKERDEEEILFHVPSLHNFSVDFEIFSKFGTKLIGKTTVIPSLFQSQMVNGWSTLSSPIYDTNLLNIGVLTFDYNVILPFNGTPLGITEYDTYWKATVGDSNLPAKIGNVSNSIISNNNNSNNNSNNGGNNNNSNMGILTSSSLGGKYVTLRVFALNDSTIVCSPKFFIENEETKFLLNDLTKIQLQQLMNSEIDILPSFEDAYEIETFLQDRVVNFSEFIAKVPPNIQLEIQVCFPTNLEMELIPIKMNPKIDCNSFIDQILSIVFDHERIIRKKGLPTRPILFSSCNLQACSILNWKQPNFPVLFNLKSIKSDKNNIFYRDSPHNLKDLSMDSQDVKVVDNRSSCIRDIIRFATDNNLLGVILPSELLQLSQALINAITSHGLLVVGSIENDEDLHKFNLDINGVSMNSSLVFLSGMDI